MHISFMHHRHDEIRDKISQRLAKTCRYIETGPHINPLTSKQLITTANKRTDSRLYINANVSDRENKEHFQCLSFQSFSSESTEPENSKSLCYQRKRREEEFKKTRRRS